MTDGVEWVPPPVTPSTPEIPQEDKIEIFEEYAEEKVVELTVGESITWELPITGGAVEQLDTVEVDLSQVKSFASFDKNKLEIQFDGALLTSEFAGSFLIVIKVKTENG